MRMVLLHFAKEKSGDQLRELFWEKQKKKKKKKKV